MPSVHQHSLYMYFTFLLSFFTSCFHHLCCKANNNNNNNNNNKKPICIMSTGLPRPGLARSAHRGRIKFLRGYVSKSSAAVNPLTITQLACERYIARRSMRSALRGPAHQLAVRMHVPMAIIIIAQSTGHAPCASNCACAEGLHFSAFQYQSYFCIYIAALYSLASIADIPQHYAQQVCLRTFFHSIIHNGSVVYGCFIDAFVIIIILFFQTAKEVTSSSHTLLPSWLVIDLSRCVCVGTVVCQIVTLCPMVYVREVCSLQFYLLYIWMLLGGSLCGCSVLCR